MARGWRRNALVLGVVAAGVAVPAAAAVRFGWNGTPAATHGPDLTAAALAHATQVYRVTPPSDHPTPAPAALGPTRGGHHAWLVGFAKELLDPSAADIASGNFHLGGYGILPTRQTQGPLVDGDGAVEHLYVRAVAISNRGGQTLLLADLENQGTFTAYKQGPFGIYDIRQKVAGDLGIPFDSIVVSSDHSHAGPDLIGLWGGVPVDYLQYVHDQTVKALEAAYRGRVAADLRVGGNTPVVPDAATGGYVPGTATPGEYFDHSQFSQDSNTGYPDQAVDTQLRVLQAYGEDGRPLGTLINYAAHATVMSGSNVLYSADWPGRVARATEMALAEPVAVTMVADVGRTQPPRPCSLTYRDSSGSTQVCGNGSSVSADVDRLDTWTRLFTPWVVDAVAHASPVRGTEIAGSEVLTQEAATNPALLGVTYTGELPVRGYGAYRAATTPWFTGSVVGTYVSAHRLGDILLTASPGEAYPDIRLGLQRELTLPDGKPLQAFFTFGLANDQLGYLIAPASEYPWITYSQPGNDNSFFNVSVQYGDHIYCTQLAEATGAALGFRSVHNPNPYGAGAQVVQPNCSVQAASDGAPAPPVTQQPWPFGDGAALPSPFPQ